MEEFNYDNEVIEISNEDNSNNEESIHEEPEKKPKKSLKDKWKDLPKKKKVLIISLSVVILLVILGVVLYFVFFKKDKDVVEPPKKEEVILEKDNYRYENGKLIFLNASDQSIGEYSCEVKDANKCFVAKIDFGKDTFDRAVSVYENGTNLEKTSSIYHDRFVFINDNNKIILYDIKDKEEALEVNSFKPSLSNDYVVVETTQKLFGLIEIKEDNYEYVIRASYDYLGLVNEKLNYLVAKDKDKSYIIDGKGKKLTNIFVDIKDANANYIVGYKNNSYSLFDYNYNELLSDYDYIGLHDNLITYVNSKKLYVLDDNLNKLHIDGIRLSSSDYVKKYVYNDENKLIETKNAYEVSVEGNKLKVNILDDTKEYNIFEGSLSSNLNYVNYFDGKLYFYSDNEKMDLLGTYTCQNKNIISSSNDTLKNCFIYSNSDGISGIYNNDYVFIFDNASTNDKTYYLYSLKEKKSKGTYNTIEIVNKKELNSDIKQIFTSSSYIISKSGTGNNKNNYGVLEINGSKVTGKVEFKYESIEKIKDYYLLINVDKSYSVYNSNFKKVSNEFDYIEIFDNYYVGIKNKLLNVYKFDNGVGILESDLEVNSNEFKIDFTNGFNITIDGNTYNYSLDGKVIEGE